jgi:hypothetical protein
MMILPLLVGAIAITGILTTTGVIHPLHTSIKMKARKRA